MENDAHILVVEDSPTQAMELQYFLENNGYKVSVAEDGEQALAVLKDITPHHHRIRHCYAQNEWIRIL